MIASSGYRAARTATLANMHGGEIVIPKIPSIRIVDLARAMAPDTPHKIVGIRPGEKLHEVLITEDDSRETVDLGDRYIIEPAFTWWNRESYATEGAERVEEGFRYASNNNPEMLDIEGIRARLKDAGI